MESTKKQFKCCFGRRKDKEEEDKEEDSKKRWFLDNGSIFLKDLIADCNGKSIPIRFFSSDQILKATNNFDSTCFVSEGWYCNWYRGRIEDRSYLIKRFTESNVADRRVKEVYNDIVLSARMSNHNNFLKVLGCCLEFPYPVLLFEDAEHGVLNIKGGVTVNGKESLLPLGLRLKIGKEIANSVTYLHMAFPKTIIHRDVKPMNVFLDKNWNAKLSDFSIAISLEEGKTQIKAELKGTVGYIDPSHFATGLVTEYTDVYSFGVFLLGVMTGIEAIFTGSDGKNRIPLISYVEGLRENGKLNELIDPVMMEDITITSDQRLQVEACVMLALRCCERRLEDTPKMIQVDKELKRIETSFNNSS